MSSLKDGSYCTDKNRGKKRTHNIDLPEDLSMKHRPIIKIIFLSITAALALPCSTMAAAVDSKPGQPAGDNSVLSMVFDCPARDLDVRSMRCATAPFDYVSLSKIPFRHDETTLDARAITTLDAAIIYLHLHVDSVRRVLINGHADDVGYPLEA